MLTCPNCSCFNPSPCVETNIKKINRHFVKQQAFEPPHYDNPILKGWKSKTCKAMYFCTKCGTMFRSVIEHPNTVLYKLIKFLEKYHVPRRLAPSYSVSLQAALVAEELQELLKDAKESSRTWWNANKNKPEYQRE